MLEGINILNQNEIMTDPKWLPWVAILGGLLIFIVLTEILAVGLELGGFGIFVSGACAVFYLFIMVCGFESTVPTGRYRYEATIDESVTFEELYERYDVIEQKGKIYILEDKEKK